MKFLFPYQFLLIWLCLFDKSFGVTSQRRKSICGYACEYVCNKACESCEEKCKKVCESICGRKKREVSESPQLSCTFAAWDKNGDTNVDVEEFTSVGFTNINKADLSLAFQTLDTDGNRLLSQKEMQTGEMLLENC